MIAVTFAGGPAWLLAYEPDWSRPVILSARVPHEVTRSLAGREYREPVGSSLRCTLRWGCTLDVVRMNRLRDACEAYADEPVLAPVWPLALPGDTWPGLVGGGVLLGWNEGFTSFALSPAVPADWDWVAPVLVGRWEELLPELLQPEAADVEFALEEDGDAALALAPDPVSWTSGPALNDGTVPKVFALDLDWSRPPRSGAPTVEVQRRAVGEAPRTRLSVFYPQNGAQRIEASLSIEAYWEAHRLLRWWQDSRGGVVAHYIFSPASTAALASDAAAGATTLVLADAASLGNYRYLCLTNAFGAVEYVRVSSIAGNSCTLVSALASTWPASSTIVSVAALARHASDEVELTFAAPGVGKATLTWEELPEEYIIGDLPDEARGTTVGAGTAKAWLYEFRVDRGGSPTVYRYTSYERALTVEGNAWAASPISHSDVSASLRLDRDELTLSLGWLPWCEQFLPGRLAAKVLLVVKECDVSGASGSNVVVRWTGEVQGIEADGPLVKARGKGPYALFARPCPRLAMQPGCNHAVYDAECGLVLSQWEFSAVVTAAAAHQITLGSWARVDAGALPAGFGFANWFALGYLDRGAAARQTIRTSTALSSGTLVLTLDRLPSVAFTVGESVVVVPWCDNRPQTCKAWDGTNNPAGKFNNFARYGGFPGLPEKNPSFAGLRKTDSPYGKK